MDDALKIGVVGTGHISGSYLETLDRLDNVVLTAVAGSRADAIAASRPGVRALTLAQLCAAPDVDVVLNLTTPKAHAEVALAALAGGKHVYGEKPLAASTAGARQILDAAAERGLTVGCAPDTVLGTGTQTARAVLDAGEIGRVVAATAFMTCPGHERWHPAPDFYYQAGGGPLLDMGPYYLTALVNLLGPVRRVVGMSAMPRATRVIRSGPRAGARFPVEVATHVTGVLEHEAGELTTLIMSFDVWDATLPRIEVYGTDGSLSVPDPDGFDGPVRIFLPEQMEWADTGVRGGYSSGGRGFGLADMASAITAGTPHRTDAAIAYHVLDVMECLLATAQSGSAADVPSRCRRPEPVSAGAVPWPTSEVN